MYGIRHPQNTISEAALNADGVGPKTPFVVLKRTETGFMRAESGIFIERSVPSENGWSSPVVRVLDKGIGAMALVGADVDEPRLDMFRAGIVPDYDGTWVKDVFTIEDDTDQAQSA